MICLIVIHAGGKARPATTLYHHFIWCNDSLWWGGSEVRRSSILPPAVSTYGFQSAFKLDAIWQMRRQYNVCNQGLL